jgi:hypothetical protein
MENNLRWWIDTAAKLYEAKPEQDIHFDISKVSIQIQTSLANRLLNSKHDYKLITIPISEILSLDNMKKSDKDGIQFQISALREGSCRPITVDQKNNIIDGNHRVYAAKALGMHSVMALKQVN